MIIKDFDLKISSYKSAGQDRLIKDGETLAEKFAKKYNVKIIGDGRMMV